jgi:hypothetical protein
MTYLAIAIGAHLLLAILMSGCTTTKPGSPEAFLEKQEEKREMRKEMVKDTIDELPEWFMDVPKSDNAIHSVGSGTSPDLQLAIDKSILHAKRTLADRIEGRLSSQVKEYITETGKEVAPPALKDTERVTKNIMREVNVAGYSVKEMEIKPHHTFFRVYVLLMYPLGEANELLQLQHQRRVLSKTDDSAKNGYKELDKERDKKEAL